MFCDKISLTTHKFSWCKVEEKTANSLVKRIPLFGFTLNTDRFGTDSEVRRKVYIIHLTHIVAFFSFALMGVLSFIENYQTLGFVDMIMAMVTVLLIVHLNLFRNIDLTIVLSTVIAAAFIFGVLVQGGAGGDAFVWYYTFPLFAVFVLGPKRGVLVASMLGGAAIVFFLLDHAFPQVAHYKFDFKLRFMFSYFVVVIFSYVADNFRELTYKKLQRSYETLDHKVNERTQELIAKNIALEVASTTDALTGLKNRMKLDEVLHHEINMAKRYSHCFCIVLIDLDHFKKVNDTYGHIAGDEVLRAFSDMMKKSIRTTDTIGRWGGEEFLVICPSMDNEHGLLMAEKLRSVICSAEFPIVDSLTASFGVTCYRNGDNINSIVKRADDALYSAKKDRNSCCTCGSL